MRIMKILKVLTITLIVVAALITVMGLFAKNDYHLERSIEIDAPREMIYEYVRYFENMKEWSPWAELDPNMQDSIIGPDGEVGTIYSWNGNEDAGKGRQRITKMSPDRIEMEVQIYEPWESTNPAFMTFEDQDSLTKVTWGYDMHIAFPWNGFAMFTDINSGLGLDYERGLDALKRICEKMAHPKYGGYEVALEEKPVWYFAGIRALVPMADVGSFYQDTLPAVFSRLQEKNILMTGQPCGLYWTWDDSTATSDMAAAIPIGSQQDLGSDVSVFALPAGTLAKIDYYGNYDSIGKAHLAMDTFMMVNKYTFIPPAIEQYISDPSTEPDSTKWLTRVLYFVKPDSL